MGKPSNSHSGSVWAWINSPIAITLISGGILAGAAKVYSDRQVERADIESRRDEYVDMLAEYEQRVSLLTGADGELNDLVGEGPHFEGRKKIPQSGPLRELLDRKTVEVGKVESMILKGNGTYAPTTPAFKDVDLLTLAARMERTAGIPDIQLGSLRIIGTLDTPPDLLWIMVRAHLPMMQQFAATRHMMFTDGQLPLARGASLSEKQERILGYPERNSLTPEQMAAKSDRIREKLKKVLKEADGTNSGDTNTN